MRQKLLLISGGLIIILLVIVGVQQYLLYQTKQYSPEASVKFVSDNVTIEVNYSRPMKNGRVIFGGLVPYGQWWRTGANEPTTINLSRDVVFEDSKILPAGKYAIVTIPHEDYWELIFNADLPNWGTKYDASTNVLSTRMRVEELPQTIEQFLIDFSEKDESAELIMAWDKTRSSVSFKVL